jgi:hypothetical protein
MDTVTDSEKLAINNKWVDLDTDIDYGPIIRIVSIVGALIVVVFFRIFSG